MTHTTEGELGAPYRDKGKVFGVIDRLDGQIHVQVWPIEVVRLRQFHIQDRGDGSFAEPGELVEWQEKLFPAQQQPKAVLRNVGNFNGQSVRSTRL